MRKFSFRFSDPEPGDFPIKKSRLTDSQIAFILRQAEEGTSVEDVCRKAGISAQTYFRWRQKYGGLIASEMKRLKQPEEENQCLRRLVADQSQDKEMLQDVIRRLCPALRSGGATRPTTW